MLRQLLPRGGHTGSEGLVESVEMVTAGGDDPTGPGTPTFPRHGFWEREGKTKKLIHNINSRT